jgi:hypothetical protein
MASTHVAPPNKPLKRSAADGRPPFNGKAFGGLL